MPMCAIRAPARSASHSGMLYRHDAHISAIRAHAHSACHLSMLCRHEAHLSAIRAHAHACHSCIGERPVDESDVCEPIERNGAVCEPIERNGERNGAPFPPATNPAAASCSAVMVAAASVPTTEPSAPSKKRMAAGSTPGWVTAAEACRTRCPARLRSTTP